MKVSIFVILITVFSLNCLNAQEAADTFRMEDVDVKPEFFGGTESLVGFFNENFKQPSGIIKNGNYGKMQIDFIVNAEGKVSDVKIARGLETSLDKEVLRVFKSMPDWIPGVLNGDKVNVSMSQSLAFQWGDTAYYTVRYSSSDTIPYSHVDVKPVFPGGESALMKFIAENCKYPEYARSKGIQGRVFVQFVIDANGKVTNPEVVKGVESHLDAEAVRVVSLLPEWTPAYLEGEIVATSFVVPINFKLYKLNQIPRSANIAKSDPANCGGLIGAWRMKRAEKKEKKK